MTLGIIKTHVINSHKNIPLRTPARSPPKTCRSDRKSYRSDRNSYRSDRKNAHYTYLFRYIVLHVTGCHAGITKGIATSISKHVREADYSPFDNY